MNYLRAPGDSPRYCACTKLKSNLDTSKPYLHSHIAQASPIHLSNVVLYGEIKALGYKGSLSLLQQYLRHYRDKPQPKPIMRFKTPPGKQMQIDRGQVRSGKHPIHAFITVLAYSRAMFVIFTDNIPLKRTIEPLSSTFKVHHQMQV